MNGSDSENVKVILSIGGTEYEGIECLLPLNRPIRECVESFNLPRFDDGGNPLQYLLGRIREGEEEEILELEDEDGREMTLSDYNIQSGDHLHLIPVPISGGSPTRPLSIPRKTSFLQSVRRWMKGLVTRREEINTTLFAPFMAERGTTMTIQVLFYRDSQYHQIKHEAQLVDPDATERSTRSLGIPVKNGDDLCAHLCFFTQQSEVDSIRIMNCEKHITWNSNLEILVFHAFVDRSFTRSVLNGNVDILLNGVPVSAIAFNVKIVDEMGNSKTVADIQPTQFDRVFISYSHADAEKVQYISETCRAVNCEYFFDRHILSPGDLFVDKIFHYIDDANLFILCWSQNAANSEWVDRERKRALENWNKGGHSIRIYPISINPKADLPEDMKDTFIFGELS